MWVADNKQRNFFILGSVPDVVGERSRQIVDTDVGKNIELRCTMEGQAGITMDWYKEEIKLQQSKKVQINTTDVGDYRFESILSLHNVTVNENGNKYVCKGKYPQVDLYASYSVMLRVGGR